MSGKYLRGKFNINGMLLILPNENFDHLSVYKSSGFSDGEKNKLKFLENLTIPISADGSVVAKTLLRKKPVFILKLRKFSNEKDARRLRSELEESLSSAVVSDAYEIADLLVDLDEIEVRNEYLPLWKDEKSKSIVQFIRDLSGIKAKSDSIGIAVDKTTKIIYALKAYTKKDILGIKEKTDIHDGIESVLTIYENYLKQGITVYREFGDIPDISCFPSDITQIWTNLIFNAIQAMEGLSLFWNCQLSDKVNEY